jgi:hypothetical protein
MDKSGVQSYLVWRAQTGAVPVRWVPHSRSCLVT